MSAPGIPLEDVLRHAATLQAAGRLAEAEHAYLEVLAAAPSHFASLQMLGVIAAQRGRLDEARQRLAQAVAVQPGSAAAHSDLGSVLKLSGRHEEALACFERALALRPEFVEVLANQAAAQSALGRHEEALASCERALASQPHFPDAWNNRGVALMGLARHDEALASFERALALRPGTASALHNRATALLALGRSVDALASCDLALSVAPGHADAHDTKGVALHELGRYAEAIASFDRVLALQPDHRRALANRLLALTRLGRFDLAVPALERALAVDADVRFAQGLLLHARMNLCDWRNHAAEAAAIVAGVRAGKPVTEPFVFLAITASAEDALTCARTTAQLAHPPAPHPLWRGERYAHDRIRVAYLSSDFGEHATAYLLAEVLERHDRARFAVSAVSWGPATPGPMRQRLAAACEQFADVRGQSDPAVARWLRAQEIDVAVDLKGYTFEARPGILAHRPAPVQVSYLGYPGTLGAPYLDYLIADATVIPLGHEGGYTERVVRLPDTYQPNDRRRAIAPATPSRTAHGLPERGFVFCSFNNPYKLLPAQFDAWMRLLRDVEGSVLWLLEGNPAVPGNLRREAESRGVAGARLVFAPRMPLAEHLARHRLADLFLDTLPCNAHTTASDALWAGLPVLTCLGGTFAGRVAGSLLRAANLPELVTESMADYEALAARLATHPGEVAALRDKLAANRLQCALFDSARYTRHLEAAYETMFARAQRGQPPAAFAVAPVV